MPFDGTFVRPGSPLAILLEADRKLTAERRAAALLRKPPAPPVDKAAQRVAQARASVAVLDALLELFADGEHWMQGDFYDRTGSYCLVGGLQRVRRMRKAQDKAGLFLLRAIRHVTGERAGTLIHFNDDLETEYADVRRVIGQARELAQQVADGVV